MLRLKDRADAPIRYFGRVYPLLWGARGRVPLTGRFTDPGRDQRLEWVLGELEGMEGGSVLDAGCGAGLYSIALARRGHRVTCVDVSDEMLASTRRAAVAAGVDDRIELIHADVRSWRPGRRFAIVLSLGVVEYYPEAARILERQFDWTEGRMLVTWSAPRPGSRTILRRAWLAMHGLRVPLLEASELSGMLSGLPEAEVHLGQTFWAHCAVVDRLRPTRFDALKTSR